MREKIRRAIIRSQKTTHRDRDTRKNWIRKKKREVANRTTRAVQYLPGDRVVEILRLPGKGEFDCDAKKRRQREERCCCCGSKRGSVFGRHVSFCEEEILCVAIGDSFFVHFYLDLSTPRSSSNKNESFLRFPRDAILSLVVCK